MKDIIEISLCHWRRTSYLLALEILKNKGWKIINSKRNFFNTKITLERCID